MTNRKIYFKVANKLEGPYFRSKGGPQGSVLSPLLYNIYVAGIALIIDKLINIFQYADDTLLTCAARNIQEGINRLEQCLRKVNEYLKSHKLPLSVNKTKFIIFTQTEFKSIEQYQIEFDNVLIKPSRVIRYLGMYLDYKMTWQDHFNFIIGKATRLSNVIKCLRNTWWGGHPQVLLNVYKCLIRSTIEYNLYLRK